MNLQLKFKLASACLILTVVVGMMTSLIVYEKQRLWESYDQEQKAELDKLARVFQDTAIMADEAGMINYVSNLLNLSAPRVVYAGVVYEEENMGPPWLFRLDNRQPRLEYLDNKDAQISTITSTRKVLRNDHRLFDQNVTELSRPVGNIGYVRLGYSRDVVAGILRANVNLMIKRYSVVGLIAVIFGLLLAHLFSTALARPISRLMVATEQIAKGQKGVQLPVESNDELGRLTHTFNRMSQELIKLDQLKDDFMSHVTHELRSPLTSIIATVELMAEMPIAEKDPKFRRSIDRMIFGSERLNRLVDNILDLMRMEAGKMNFDIQPVNLSKLLMEMADFFEPRAMEKNLKIRAVVPADIPLVMADSERVRQIISNLVHNAVKFTNKGGIVLWARKNGEMVEVGVQDTGVGIPADKLSTVFNKFECLKDTKDRVEKPVPGSGLGLNIVQNSVKAQGGAIWVESEVDVGSTFIFTLPVAPATVQPGSNPIPTAIASSLSIPPEVAHPRQAVLMPRSGGHA